MRSLRIRLLLLVLVGSFVSLAGTARPAAAAEGQLVKAVLVIVNGRRITQGDLNAMAETLLRIRYGKRDQVRLSPQEEQELAEVSLRELIRIRLILDEVEDLRRRQATDETGQYMNLELSVSAAEVDEQLERMGVPPREAAPVARLFAEAELLASEVLKARGFSGYRATPGEIRKLYREDPETFTTNAFVRVRHIFLSTAGATEPASVKRDIERLRKAIERKPAKERSAYVAEIAREYSEDRFGPEGGLLRLSPDPQGWFPQAFVNQRPDGEAVLPDKVYRGIHTLRQEDVGTVTDVIRSEQGFHLLFLEALRGGKRIPWSEAQKLIENHLQKKARNEQIQRFLRQKVQKSRITWHDGEPYPVGSLFAEDSDAEGATRRR